MPDEGPTFHALISAFTDFLTIAIHIILYERNIYPRSSFLHARKYNSPVWQSRHPKVCDWINDAIAQVEDQLLKDSVDRVIVVIYNKASMPLERFVFDTSRFPAVSEKYADLPLQHTMPSGDLGDILPMVDLEEQFRATLAKLTNSGSKLQPVPEGCTFAVAIELKAEGEAPLGHPQAWVPVPPNLIQVSSDEGHRKKLKKQVAVTPLRAVAAGGMIFETWVEEARLEARAAPSSGDTVSTSFG